MLQRFSFFKKRAFRSGVRVSMSYLVGFSEILNSMFKIYPGIRTAIDADFVKDNNANQQNTAIVILTAIFTQEIEQKIPEPERAEIEKYIIKNNVEPDLSIARGIKTFLSQTTVQKDLGRVDDYLYGYVISEIVGALRGIPANERSGNRVAASFLSLTNPG